VAARRQQLQLRLPVPRSDWRSVLRVRAYRLRLTAATPAAAAAPGLQRRLYVLVGPRAESVGADEQQLYRVDCRLHLRRAECPRQHLCAGQRPLRGAHDDDRRRHLAA